MTASPPATAPSRDRAPIVSAPLAPPLSAFVIARDEADRLPATLDALRGLADEVVVVDSGSTDGTREVAAAHGARVIEQPFLGYGLQKRVGEEACRHDWLLNVDADEVVSPALRAEVLALFAAGAPGADGYRVPIAEIFPGEGEPHRLAYALAPVRLYRRSKGRYVDSPVHDRVAMAPGARVARLRGRLHHFSVRSIGDQMDKLNRYTTRQAEDLAARGLHVPTWRLFVEFPASFLKAYVGRRHFARGVYGFMTAMNFAFYRWLRVAKDVERRRVAARRAAGGAPP